MMKKFSWRLKYAPFLIILALAIYIRHYTFSLPHFRGDQAHYVSLAFKLNTKGFDGYNLRGIDEWIARDYPNLIALLPAEDEGNLMKDLKAQNIFYYDQPFHHVPFAFPAMLVISHSIISADALYHLVYAPDDFDFVAKNPGRGLRDYKLDKTVLAKQLYAVIVPFIFSISLIMLTYFFAFYVFRDYWVSSAAMALMAASPIDILTSQKIWADDITAFFALLAVFLYYVSVDKDKAMLSFFGGMAAGLGMITKQTGAFIVFVVIAWHLITNVKALTNPKTFLRVIFDKKLALFGLGALASSWYWFYKLISFYGNPVYMPKQPDLAESAKTIWFNLVSQRPWYTYIAGIPYQNPVFIFAYLSPLCIFMAKQVKKNILTLLSVWIVVFLVTFFIITKSIEHRYMLPCYAAFAVLSAYILNRVRVYIDEKTPFKAGTVIFLATLAISVLWSANIGLEALFGNDALILKPF